MAPIRERIGFPEPIDKLASLDHAAASLRSAPA